MNTPSNEDFRKALEAAIRDAARPPTMADIMEQVRRDAWAAVTITNEIRDRHPPHAVAAGDDVFGAVLEHIGRVRDALERRSALAIAPSVLAGFIAARAEPSDDEPEFDVPPGIDPN